MVNSSASKLILASASPRRGDLLREAGYVFSVDPADIDEARPPGEFLPAELAKQLASEKAKVVAARHPEDVTLGADTVVAFGDRAIGKPTDERDAADMLQLLAGTTHIVITGVCIVCPASHFERAAVAMSAVRMRQLSAAEIGAYVAGGQWRGKAGGYGIQDDDPFVERMRGSQSNIVGLPMELTRKLLAEAGIKGTGQ